MTVTQSRLLNPNELRELRKQHKLTQQQAADLMCVAVATIRSWESGRRRISRMANTLFRIQVLGEKPDYTHVQPDQQPTDFEGI